MTTDYQGCDGHPFFPPGEEPDWYLEDIRRREVAEAARQMMQQVRDQQRVSGRGKDRV